MKQLKSLGVSRAILITAYLPILLIGVLLWFVVSDLNQTIQSNQNTQAIVKLTTLFDAVAHTHAVERGVTAGFLGSKGAKGRDKLDQARVNADQAVRAFSALNIKDYSFLSQQQFMALTKDLQQQLQQKSQTRNLVDALNPQADAFNYYSALNKLALDSIRRLISLVENNDSAQDLDSRLKLLWIKERAGQYRGMLNGVFSKQTTSTVQRERVKGFVEDENSYLISFTQWASAEQTNSLLQLAKQQHWKEVSAITSAYISSNALTITETPSNWFDLATKRIQDIKKLSDEFGELIRSSAAEQTSATLVERNTILVISALLLIPTIFIAHKVSSSIAERVHKINVFLKRLSNEHDFTQTIKDNANDEISSIVKSLQKHAEETRKCLRQIQDQNTLSTNLVLKTSDNILANTSEVESQKNQTAEISAAISQMLQVAEAIADDIQTASTEIGSVQKQSISSSQSMQDISSEFATLNGEVTKSNKIINELVEHTDGISQILSNIQSIAEQTNLLALNAAIEAARAGEQGRGFAVVADEVRNLAKRTQDSTGEISSMLSNLSESAQKAISSMSQCLDLSNTSAQKMHENEEKIKPLYNSLNSLNGLFEQIATAAEEQSVVSRQIYVSVQQVDDGANNIYSGNANSQQSLKEMSDNFAYTSELVQRFKVS